MKREFEDKKNFDMDRIKSLEKKRIVWNALNYMQLTLTPLLYINYLRAIGHTHYKVAMEILRAIDGFEVDSAIDPDLLELPLVGSDTGQALLLAILCDMQRCHKTYRGGFVYGIINEMNLADGSVAYETLKEFIANYFNRVNDYVCNDR